MRLDRRKGTYMPAKFAVSLVFSLLLAGVVLWFGLRDPGGADPSEAREDETRSPAAPSGAGPGQASTIRERIVTGDTADTPASVATKRGSTLHGRVTDASGAELAGARILVYRRRLAVLGADPEARVAQRELALGRVRRERPAVVAETLTDKEGRYALSITDIPRGYYRVLAAAEGFAPASKPWTWTFGSSRLDFELLPGGTIEGVVLDPTDAPVEGALVEARAERESAGSGPAGELADQTRSDASGRFRLSVGDTSHAVVAGAPGFSPVEKRRVPARTHELVLRLGESRAIRGEVRDGDGEAIPDVTVSLVSGSGRFQRTAMQIRLLDEALARAVSDSSGRFQFSDLAPDDYSILAERPSFRPEQVRVDLVDTGSADVELRMERGRRIEGRVVDDEGSPVAGAFVVASRDDAGSSGPETEAGVDDSSGRHPPTGRSRRRPIGVIWASAATETAGDGSFRLDTLDEAIYRISAEAEGLVARREEGIDLRDDSREIEIVLGAGVRLKGRVLSSLDNEPVAAARLRFQRDRQVITIGAGEDGAYEVGGFVPGDPLKLEVYAPGFAPTVARHVQVEPDSRVQGLDVRLDPAGWISGQVVDTSGFPVPRARVRVEEVSDRDLADPGSAVPGGARSSTSVTRLRERRESRSATADTTDGQGLFVLDEVVPDRPVCLVVEHRRYRAYRGEPLSLSPGERVEDMSVQLARGSLLLVYVRDPEGRAVSGARVRVRPHSGPGPDAETTGIDRPWNPAIGSTWGVSDADGLIELSGMEAGLHAVSCVATGFQPFATTVHLIEDRAVELTVRLVAENVIRGEVTDMAGRAVEGAYLGALLEAGPDEGAGARPVSSARSSKDGVFRIGGLGQGPHALWIERHGFVPRLVTGVSVNTRQRIALERLGSVAGRVESRETGAPVREFEIRLSSVHRAAAGTRGEGAGSTGGSWQAFRAADGAFRLDDVRPGSYFLEASAGGFTGVRVALAVADGENLRDVVVTLLEGASVTGLVHDGETGRPVAGAEILLVPGTPGSGLSAGDGRGERPDLRVEAGGSRPSRGGGEAQTREERVASALSLVRDHDLAGVAVPVESDVDGRFRLPELPAGRYTLVVRHESYLPLGEEIWIEDARGAPERRLALDRGEAVRGRVTVAGQPPGGPVPLVFEGPGGLQKRVVTDAAGRYSATGFLSGSYTVRASRVGGHETPTRITIGPGENELEHELAE